jgi:hypothetical protein
MVFRFAPDLCLRFSFVGNRSPFRSYSGAAIKKVRPLLHKEGRDPAGSLLEFEVRNASAMRLSQDNRQRGKSTFLQVEMALVFRGGTR